MKRVLLYLTAAIAAPPAMAAQWRPFDSVSQAPLVYWLVAFMTIFLLLVFIFWALWAPRPKEQNTSTGRYHALGALVVVMTLFTLILYVVVAERIDAMGDTEGAWDWQPGQVMKDPGGSQLSGEPYRGYQVYLAEGCTYCHTMYVRPQDIPTGWAPGATEEDITQPGDFANYPFTLLGTQRNGPDLTITGRQIPDMGYHMEHLKNPRQFKPDSVMPRYDYMTDRNLRDLSAYLVSLGNDPDALRAGKAAAPKSSGKAGQAPATATAKTNPAERGRELYRARGCVGCHSIDGSRNVGPSLKGLFGHEITLKNGETTAVDAAYIKESILDPGAAIAEGYPPVMPDNFDDLSAEDIDALVAFIKSLGEAGQE